jgi:hypothetical protein
MNVNKKLGLMPAHKKKDWQLHGTKSSLNDKYITPA